MFAPVALHATPPSRPVPSVVADTAARDSNIIHLAALARAVVDTFEARGVKSPSGLLAVSVGVGGAGAQLNVIGGNVPDSLRGSVGRVVTEYVRRRGTETPLAFTIRLERVARADTPMPADGDEERPHLRNPGKVREYMARIINAYPTMKRGMHDAVVDMHLNRDGRVAIVYIAEWSGAEDINPYLAALANEMEFTPARVGGQAVPAWVRQTFTFGAQ